MVQSKAKSHTVKNTKAQDDFQPNPRLMYIEAMMFAAIAIIGAAITYQLVGNHEDKRVELAVPGMIEAETLTITEQNGEFTAALQDTSSFTSGQWTNNQHLFITSKSSGNALNLKLPPRDPGTYDLTLYLSKSFDYGIIQIYVNGKKIGVPIDLWSYAVESTGPLPIGVVKLRGRNNVIRFGQDNVIRFEVTGKNDRAKSPFYQFGIDGLVLHRIP